MAKPEFAWIERGRIVRHGTYENNDFRIRYKPIRESGSAQQGEEKPQPAQEVLTLRVTGPAPSARKQEL